MAHATPARVVGVSFALGAVPFSNIAARAKAGVDLRVVGNGTVSGTNLFHVAGFGPLAVAGVCDVAKGAVGPLLAGRDRPVLAAVAGGRAGAGDKWAPFLSGGGGRGPLPPGGGPAPRAGAGGGGFVGGVSPRGVGQKARFGVFCA